MRNFRNYKEAHLFFSPQFNFILGDNAQGKTNLLEAIALISTGRSFRSEHFTDLIGEGAPFFFLEAKLIKDKIEHTVQVSFDGKEKKLVLDGNVYTSLQHLLGLLPSVLYSPKDSELIEGAPALRRRFLNLHLAQRDPLYIHHLARYWRAMKQRNALLKAKDLKSVDAWETQMAASAHYLLEKREGFFSELESSLKKTSALLNPQQELYSLKFQRSQPTTTESYLSQMKKNRIKEQQLGFTLTGPHRDDFLFLLQNKEASSFASEGQKRTAVAALRFSEWEILAQATQTTPLFALDDLGTHLDKTREILLHQALRPLGQVFLTSTKAFAQEGLDGKILRVCQGTVDQSG